MSKRNRQRSLAAATADAAADQRAAMRSAVRRYLRKHHRGDSMDAVLARPCDALRMGIAIASEFGQLRNGGRAAAISKDVARYAEITPEDVAAIHRVLQSAMAARKRGELRIEQYADAEGA